MNHRFPPMPPHFRITPWGVCRWCNKSILKDDGSNNGRRRWHPECLHDYLIVSKQKYAKRQVKKRDKGICCKCGKFCRYRYEWQLDHIKPLIEANGDIAFWQMGNLCTLCNACHEAKTVDENIKRAAMKRERKKADSSI